MSGTLERPEREGDSVSSRPAMAEPISLPCVDVGNEIAAGGRHSLPPRNAAQFNDPYGEILVMVSACVPTAGTACLRPGRFT